VSLIVAVSDARTLCFLGEGLRFLRLIYLLKTPELLQMLYIIKSNNRIRVAKALSVVHIVWILGAGMYFLVSGVTSLLHHYRRHYVERAVMLSCRNYMGNKIISKLFQPSSTSI